MEQIKRYTFSTESEVIIQDPEGEWVRWDDVKLLIDSKENLVEKLKKMMNKPEVDKILAIKMYRQWHIDHNFPLPGIKESKEFVESLTEKKELDWIQIQQETIAHYDRMIAWAEKQPEKGLRDIWLMEEEIGENTTASYCAYCQTMKVINNLAHSWCYKCPLAPDCCNGLWQTMKNSDTWKQWVKDAKEVRQYIIDHGVPKK